ncbi:uncharacterized protein LOC129600729 [Paramacrobiotus metropolitanus]|uniref:uncharacterized protein LOC129600729 n=1 Tax=Paramacrobiotus metropolitanus TaxID=2943436 RepID=UPI002445BC0B|nr:uncharacterized protein LOC129600729 [Paramacrobiotus metropolitanus]
MCVLCAIPSRANWALGKALSSRAMNFSLPFPGDGSVPDGVEDIVDGTCMSWEDITRVSLVILLLMVMVGLRVYQLQMELQDALNGRSTVSGNATPFKDAPGHRMTEGRKGLRG